MVISPNDYQEFSVASTQTDRDKNVRERVTVEELLLHSKEPKHVPVQLDLSLSDRNTLMSDSNTALSIGVPQS